MGDDRLQRARETALLREYNDTGDPRLRERIVEAFQPLVKSLARRYYGGGEPLEDLIQVANVGLLKAIDGFELERGRPFAAYAAPTILGELRHHFRDRAWSVRLPRKLQERSALIREMEERIAAEMQRRPTIDEVAERCELTEEEVREALVAGDARRTRSLDAPVVNDDTESAPMVELMPDVETGFERTESAMAAGAARLLPRERTVVKLRYRGELTQRQVGDEIGISQMQVSRLQRSALLKLLGAVRGEDAEPDELLERLTTGPGATASST